MPWIQADVEINEKSSMVHCRTVVYTHRTGTFLRNLAPVQARSDTPRSATFKLIGFKYIKHESFLTVLKGKLLQDQYQQGEAPKTRRGILKFALVAGVGIGFGTYLGLRGQPASKEGDFSEPERGNATPRPPSEKTSLPSNTAGNTAATKRSNVTAQNAKSGWETMTADKRWSEITEQHPAGQTLQGLFPAAKATESVHGFKKTGLSRADYLPLIVGNAEFFQKHQDARGAIIDPFENRERQYSTPAFALAAATAAAEAGRADLAEPATRALTFALDALVNKTTADNHPDFYIPMLVHAHRRLRDRVPKETADRWLAQFQAIVPEKTYKDLSGIGNWNVVHVAGEWLRRKDGLVASEQLAPQEKYLEQCVARQTRSRYFTRFGMYADANSPLAYDAFPRLWLEDMLADDAYRGPRHNDLLGFLAVGGLSTLMLLSPSGEWASGGRSSHHQWNEAQVAVICEVNARRWQKWGRPDLAGAFKRSARRALDSVRRWQRPSGELWIVKNRAEPSLRHGYENYSFHSQYNLLAAAMLAIAYERADDDIQEAPTPGERGSYVFDVRDVFHKVCASAGGAYVLVDTGADSHYDSTGLLRLHRTGVAYSPYSGNAAADRSFGPPKNTSKVGLTPGIVWRERADSPWRSLADFNRPGKGVGTVAGAELPKKTGRGDKAEFTVRYDTSGEGARPLEERYTVTEDGVEVTAQLGGEGVAPQATRVQFPALVSDGAKDTNLSIKGNRATVRHSGSTLTWEVVSPKGAQLKLEGQRVPTHNGYVQALVADLPSGTREVTWRLRLESEG